MKQDAFGLKDVVIKKKLSTAHKWQFSKCIGVDKELESTCVELSNIIELPFQNSSQSRTNALRVIMGTIVNILDQQIITIVKNEAKLLNSLRVDLNTLISFEVDVVRTINEQTQDIEEEDDEDFDED